MAVGTSRAASAARRVVRAGVSIWPTWAAVAFLPVSATALEPLYTELSAFETALARVALQDTLEHMPSRQIGRWSVTDGSARGSITPLRTFKIKSGHYCREFREVVESTAKGTRSADHIACRNGAGKWVRIEP